MRILSEALVTGASMPESIKLACGHVVFFPSPFVPVAEQAQARRRLQPTGDLLRRVEQRVDRVA
jgi:hypothetical protein